MSNDPMLLFVFSFLVKLGLGAADLPPSLGDFMTWEKGNAHD